MSFGLEKRHAKMDPWCTLEVADTGFVLFGFAKRHHGTGSLAWTRSRLVVTLDKDQIWARTSGGTVFQVGEQFLVSDVADYGIAARLAFDGLQSAVGIDALDAGMQLTSDGRTPMAIR